MRRNRIERRRDERGNVLVFVTIALVAMLAFAAWSTETGQAWTAKGQLQGVSDSAALAGAGELLEPNGGLPANPAAAIAGAQNFGSQNHSIGVAITIPAGDIQTGSWDKDNRVFTPMPGATDPTQVRAVQVLSQRTAAVNGPVPTVLGRIFGVDDIPVSATATAYIGFAGLLPPGTALLPVALDCCKISGPQCDRDYCSYVQQNPPNPCEISPAGTPGVDPELGGNTVTCLEFASSNGQQNACWTELDAGNPSINTPGLNDIIEDGNPVEVGNDEIFVDNGTKTAVLKEIFDRFTDGGAYASDPEGGGSDPNMNGVNETWLVPLPILECQHPGDGCAGGSSQKIVGVACFDVQEVTDGSDKIIKGEFVCPNDPRWDASKCDVGFGPGGEVPTIDAQYPVLVQ
jgi:Flp pilus assembly protein TadG